MQIEFLFCRVQKADSGSHIMPAVLDFLKIDASGWLVIVELAGNAELLARSLQGIRFVAKRPKNRADV
jgi:hypothetical protein